MARPGNFLELLLHAKNYFSASIATKAVGFISIPLFTRLLSPEEYGTFSVFISYVGILAVILSFNSHTAIGRYWYEKEEDFDTFLGTSIVLVLLVFFISGGLALLMSDRLARLLDLPVGLVLILIPFVLLNIIQLVFNQVFIPQKQSKLIARFSVAKSYLGFLVGVCLVLLLEENKYFGLILGQLIAGGLLSVFMFKRLKPFFSLSFKKKHLLYISGYSLPLIPYALSGPILAQFDRVMINGYIGSESAGLYSLAYNVGALPSVIIGALLLAWTPDYFSDMDSKNYQKLDSSIDKMFRVILFSVFFFMLFGSDLGLLLAGDKYHSSLHLVSIIAFGQIFIALWQFWGRNIGYAGKTIWTSIVALTAGFANIVLNVTCIPKYGYEAGAYTTVVSYMLMAGMGWFVSRFVLKLHVVSLLKIVKLILMLVAVSLIAYLIGSLHLPSWGVFISKAVLMLIFGGMLLLKSLKKTTVAMGQGQ